LERIVNLIVFTAVELRLSSRESFGMLFPGDIPERYAQQAFILYYPGPRRQEKFGRPFHREEL